MQSPHCIVNMTSDGICSTLPLDLPEGDGMGQWETSELDGIIILQSGIYWSLKKMGREPTEREKQEEFFDEKHYKHNGEWFKVSPHYQSYNRGELTPKKIVDAWKARRENLIAYSTRYTSLGSALASEELLPFLGSWRTIGRKVGLFPLAGKRLIKTGVFSAMPDRMLEDTIAKDIDWIDEGELSYKYSVPWDDSEDTEYGLIDGVDKVIYDMEFLESQW